MKRWTLLLLCLLFLGVIPTALAFEGPMYEIFPGSFADSDGDGLGDLFGVAQKADYIASLNVGAVWLTPFYPSPSYHGYDVTDYCAVNEAMGGFEGFDAMVQALHERDIAVIADLVLNHSSCEHPWFKAACAAIAAGEESPYIDYYTFSREPGADMHAVPGAEGWYYLGEFGSHMPDLNLDNESLRAQIVEIAAFWMNRGVDGFRLDAIIHYYGGDTARNTAFLAWLMGELRAINPDVYVVGEAWTDDSTIARLYESGISSLFHFSLADSTGAIANAVRDQNGSRLARTIAATDVPGKDTPFLTNHDMGRSAGVLMNNTGKMTAAAAAYLLAPGNPMIYYGEEIGMNGSGRDENKRLPMLWGEEAYTCLPPADADQAQRLKVGAAQQEEDPASLLNIYRSITSIRRAHPEIDSEPAQALDFGVKALYAVRYGNTTVLINMGKAAVELPCAQGAVLESVGEAAQDGDVLTLGAWSVAVVTGM